MQRTAMSSLASEMACYTAGFVNTDASLLSTTARAAFRAWLLDLYLGAHLSHTSAGQCIVMTGRALLYTEAWNI